DRETYRVVADMRRLGGGFTANDTIRAAVYGGLSGWEVEDERGDVVTPTGSVEGGTLTLLTAGLSVDLRNTAAQRTTGGTGQGDTTQYTISFDVTAGDQDSYVDRDAQRVLSGQALTGAGDGVAWATTTQSTAGVTDAGVANFSASGNISGDSAMSFRVPS